MHGRPNSAAHDSPARYVDHATRQALRQDEDGSGVVPVGVLKGKLTIGLDLVQAAASLRIVDPCRLLGA